MTDQRKSPTEGQGFDYSRGGESLESLCRQILEKSNGGRVKCVQAQLWQWTNDAMPLLPLTGSYEFPAGQRPHPFLVANAVRQASESGLIYPMFFIGDGVASGRLTEENAEAWLRGEVGK